MDPLIMEALNARREQRRVRVPFLSILPPNPPPSSFSLSSSFWAFASRVISDAQSISCFSTSVFHPVMLPSVETVIIHPHEVVTRIFVRWWIFIGGELCLYFRISFNKLSFASPNRPFLEPVLRLNSVPILSHNRGERSDNINLG